MFHVKLVTREMYCEKRQFGNLGEDLACTKLESLGFTIIERNFQKKWGEIDIVARETNGKLHFIEVKTGRRELSADTKVSRETYNLEENVTREKIKKLERAIQSWLAENSYDNDWQIDVVTIEIDEKRRLARFKYIEGIY